MLSQKFKISNFIDILLQLKGILIQSGYTFKLIEQKIDENISKLQSEQIVISVIGQFKRGKSSVINALLCEEILPVSVLPLTAIPVFIHYGEQRELYIKTREREFIFKELNEIKNGLFEYATEKENPENKKGVIDIKLFYPSDLLKNNIVIVDTPGIGSIYAHNTRAAQDVIPKSDIGIFVVSPDPPFTEAEMNYFQSVLPKVKTSFFVINKADTVSQQDLEEVKNFYFNILEKIFNGEINKYVFAVSSKQELKKPGDNNTGIKQLKEAVKSYINVKKTEILIDVSVHRIREILNLSKNAIGLMINSLKMPLKKLEENIGLFNNCLDNIEAKADMINGNILIRKNKIIEYLEDELNALSEELHKDYLNSFLKSIEKGKIDEKKINKVIDEISGIFEKQQKKIEKEVEEKVLKILFELKDDFENPLRELKQKTSEFFNVDIEIEQEATDFKFIKKPYFVDKNYSFSYKLLQENLFFKILPVFFKEKIILSYLKNDFENIILKNSDSIRWETMQCIQDTFIKYEGYYYDKYENMKESILDSLIKVKNAISDFKKTKEEKINELNTIYNEINNLYERL
ncbi:MAG: dynamin family protein [Candidatus Goldbacteria bacterium]|nr:dynamin family protein [Candidatus Goldiibacteriota bacterium]